MDIQFNIPDIRQARTLAPNLTRRSHKKSRAGCYTCKTRKIKCGEQKPKCGNCLLKRLDCIYPNVRTTLIKRPTSTTSFSMSDLRFFHHFLLTAYPHLPLGNDQVWINEIPQFAEHHEYLMHAMLALGASHLSRLNGVDYQKEALVHRGHAIVGLNNALSQKTRTYGESDAMLAACYALTFQASYMGDGLSDFITMVRGCALTTAKIRDENSPTAFNLEPDGHIRVMAPRFEQLPLVDSDLLKTGAHALDEIKSLLSDDVNLSFWSGLMDIVTSLQSSSADGYLKFIDIYATWYELDNENFKTFLDLNNFKAQLLLAYFISIEMLMIPLSIYEWPDRAPKAKASGLYGIIEWAENIFRNLKHSEFENYLNWPKRIVSMVITEVTEVLTLGTSTTYPSVLQLRRQFQSTIIQEFTDDESDILHQSWSG